MHDGGQGYRDIDGKEDSEGRQQDGAQTKAGEKSQQGSQQRYHRYDDKFHSIFPAVKDARLDRHGRLM